MLWDIKTASRELGVKMGTLYLYTEQGLIPHIRIGKLIKFEPQALLDWFRSGNFKRAKIELLKGRQDESRNS
jgi:excisionase family DNA binding protein